MTTFALNVPEGEYDCDVMDIRTITDEKNRKKMTWDLRIAVGPYKSQPIEKLYYLVKESVIDFLKGELKLLGFEPMSGEEFETKKHEIVGKRITITATVNKHGYPAYYIKGWANIQDAPTAKVSDFGW